MAFYTYDGAGARTVEAKGDIRDVITTLAVDEHPITNIIGREGTTDINPKSPEDALSAIDNANAYAENDAAPAAADTARTLNENYCQLMMKTAEVSDTQNAIAQYGMASELAYQTTKKVRELLRDGESTLISDQAAQAPTDANGRVAKMAGMTTLISTNTSAAFSQAAYDAMIVDIMGYGGSPSVAYMDATRKTAVGAWTTPYTRYSENIKTLTQEVLVYQSDIGPSVRMEWHPYMPQTLVGGGAVFMILDPALWMGKDLLPLGRKELPDNGAGPSRVFKWQWCPVCKAEKGNGMFTA